MRILTLNLLAAALLLFGAASASAFAVDITARGATSSLSTSDTGTVDVFLDADGGITIFSVAVVNSNPGVLLYDAAASAALAPTGAGGHIYQAPGQQGAQPSYILYTAGKPATYLKPLQTPAWLNFPPETPGTEQVNINYVENAFGTTVAGGTGIYVATMVCHVVAAIGSETLTLAFTSSNLIQTGTVVTAVSAIGVGGPITLTGAVPEPTTAMLIGIGVIGLGLAGRRRA